MLINIDGDLLESDVTILMQQCNCHKTMGAGIAKSIKYKYPEAYQADLEYPASADERFGEYSYAKCVKEERYIINLYGQYNWRKKPGEVMTNYKKLRSALEMFFTDLVSGKFTEISEIKIGVPYKMASDKAGGDWGEVSKILEEVSNKYHHDIYVYKI